MNDAILRGGRFDDASFAQATLSRADLSDASLRNTDLTSAEVDGVVLAGADLAGQVASALPGADFAGTPFAPPVSRELPECAVGSRDSFRATVLDPEQVLGDLSDVDLSCQDLTGLNLRSGRGLTSSRRTSRRPTSETPR
jgi:uncharacterized protein YjbI with pentapeptide repeats